MPWHRTDDDLPEHVKADALESAAGDPATLAAAWMTWLHMGCDCTRRRTDGAFSRARAHRAVRLPPAMIDAALAALVVARFLDETADGYQFHNWTKYQPTKADIEADRQANAERQKAYRNRHRNGVTNAVTNGVTNAPVTPEVTASVTTPHPIPSLPIPSHPAPLGEEEIRTQSVADGLRKTVAPTTAPARKPHIDIAPPADGTPAAVALAAILRAPILSAIVARPNELAAAVTGAAYPAIDVPREIAAAEAWLTANPRNAKKDGARFLNGWLTRAQERAPRVPPTHAPPVAVEEHDPIEIARQEYRSRLGLAVAS